MISIAFEDDEDSQPKTTGQFFIRYGLAVLLIFLCYVFYRDKFEPVNLFWTYTFAILITIFFLKATYVGFKHVSPKGIFPPIVTTTLGEPLAAAGEWNIYSMNDVFTGISIKKGGEGLHWRSNSGTVITPIGAENKIGRNVVGLADHKEVNLKDLPVCVVEKILQYERNPPYWFGIASVEQLSEKLDMESLSQEARDILNLKGKLKKVELSYIVKQLEENYKLTNTYKGLYEEMKQKVEEMKDMIRRLSMREEVSAKDRAMSYLFGRPGGEERPREPR